MNEAIYRGGLYGVYQFVTAYLGWYFFLILPACFSVLFLFQKSIDTIDESLPTKERNISVLKKMFSTMTKVNFVLFLIASFYTILLFGVFGI